MVEDILVVTIASIMVNVLTLVLVFLSLKKISDTYRSIKVLKFSIAKGEIPAPKIKKPSQDEINKVLEILERMKTGGEENGESGETG